MFFLQEQQFPFSQIEVSLEDQCNCEVLKGTDVTTAGATTPAGADSGDLYVNTDSGAIYFWDGDSWEVANLTEPEWVNDTINGQDLIYARQAFAANDTVVITDDGKLGIGTTNILGKASFNTNSWQSFDFLNDKDNKRIGNPITGASSEIFGSDLSIVRSQEEPDFWDTGLRLYNYGDVPNNSSHIALRRGRNIFGQAQEVQSGDRIGNIVFEPINTANPIEGSPGGGGVEMAVFLEKIILMVAEQQSLE